MTSNMLRGSNLGIDYNMDKMTKQQQLYLWMMFLYILILLSYSKIDSNDIH